MTPEMVPCPLCDQPASRKTGLSTQWFECELCGKFAVNNPKTTALEITEDRKAYLSAATRQAHEDGRSLNLNFDNVAEIADAHRSVSISQKIDRILRFIATKCKTPGFVYDMNFKSAYPVADCTTSAELMEYVHYLKRKNLLSGTNAALQPTIEGWQLLEPMLIRGGEPDRCFVAIWFDDAMDDAYNLGFENAISACGFKPYRVKGDPTNGAIIDKILAEIRRSHFVVADFTGARQSVYYEAGFAAGIGREVIGCCRADWIDKLAFDTRHLGHVVWRDPADLRESLTNSIRALIVPKA